jgi:hypothetical protein
MDHFESKKYFYICYEKVENAVPLKSHIDENTKPKNELEYRDLVF